jgi:hypothetical protein
VAIKPADLKGETAYELPEAVNRLAVGGGGRFLALHFARLRKVGVFDVNELKITQYLPTDSEDVHLAAGMTRLVLYSPGDGKLRRYNLLTGKLEKEGSLTGLGALRARCMGAASEGPLLFSGDQDSALVDLETLQRLEVPRAPGDDRINVLDGGMYWPSADGRTFGHTGVIGQPNGIASLVLQREQIKQTYEHQSTWYVVPSPDGKYLYAGGHGVLTNQGKETPDAVHSGGGGLASFMFLPAEHGPYYLHLHVKLDLPGTVPLSPGDPEHGVTVYLMGLRKPLAQLPLPKMTEYGNMNALGEIGIERSVHLIPQAKLLLVLTPSRDKLYLYPMDLEAALDKTGEKYLVVTSQPPGEARRGAALDYQITAKARAGPPTCKLESGPPGMTVSPQGQVRWDVPANLADKEVSVIVSVRDADGKQVFHSFTLALRDPAAVEAEKGAK